MFLGPDGKTYEPYKIRSRRKENTVTGTAVDVEMGGTAGDNAKAEEGDEELIEYPDDDEGAMYPLKGMSFAHVSRRIQTDLVRRGSNRKHASLFRISPTCPQHPISDSAHPDNADLSASVDRQEP